MQVLTDVCTGGTSIFGLKLWNKKSNLYMHKYAKSLDSDWGVGEKKN
jgi:hypothetical protein